MTDASPFARADSAAGSVAGLGRWQSELQEGPHISKRKPPKRSLTSTPWTWLRVKVHGVIQRLQFNQKADDEETRFGDVALSTVPSTPGSSVPNSPVKQQLVPPTGFDNHAYTYGRRRRATCPEGNIHLITAPPREGHTVSTSSGDDALLEIASPDPSGHGTLPCSSSPTSNLSYAARFVIGRMPAAAATPPTTIPDRIRHSSLEEERTWSGNLSLAHSAPLTAYPSLQERPSAGGGERHCSGGGSSDLRRCMRAISTPSQDLLFNENSACDKSTLASYGSPALPSPSRSSITSADAAVLRAKLGPKLAAARSLQLILRMGSLRSSGQVAPAHLHPINHHARAPVVDPESRAWPPADEPAITRVPGSPTARAPAFSKNSRSYARRSSDVVRKPCISSSLLELTADWQEDDARRSRSLAIPSGQADGPQYDMTRKSSDELPTYRLSNIRTGR